MGETGQGGGPVFVDWPIYGKSVLETLGKPGGRKVPRGPSSPCPGRPGPLSTVLLANEDSVYERCNAYRMDTSRQ